MILDLLARTGLLDDEMAALIVAENLPPQERIITELLIVVMDAEAVIRGGVNSTWNEKRLARQSLAIAFLTAITFTDEPEKSR
jgi:hypothetical protein